MKAKNDLESHAVAGMRYLVVEADAFQRWLMKRTLEEFGAREVFDAPDGPAALEIFRGVDRPIDVMVFDPAKPGMDGLDLMRNVAMAGLPLSLIITGALDPSLMAPVEVIAHACGMMVVGAVPKPVTANAFSRALRSGALAKRLAPGTRVAPPAFTIDEMLAGLANDEFEPFFQPKVELRTGRVRGVEALARWRHPRAGVVPPHIPPYAFIKQLEDHGQIDRLTWLMLEKSSGWCSSWRAAGVDVSVAVNVSAKSLEDLSFAHRAMEVVGRHGLEPRQVAFEVTETHPLGQDGKGIESLLRLRLQGFGISIDDYGTGYSALQQLTRFAFNEIKIDQSFVRGATAREANRVILESSLDMARRLGVVAVVEGVETQAEWDMLLGLDCELAQGYLIAAPMPGEAFIDWARGRT